MTVTVLAVLFLTLVLAVALFGFRAVITRGKSPDDLQNERCSICRQSINKTSMIEREIGDYKVLYFCSSCIAALQRDLTMKN